MSNREKEGVIMQTQLIDKGRLKGEFIIRTEDGTEILDTKALRIIDRQPIQEAITIKELLGKAKVIFDDDGIGHKVVEIKDIIREE